MYENIKGLRPYFFSLREIDNNVSLDIKFPLTWKYENIISQYKLVKAKVQDKNDKFHLVSLISTATQEGYDVVFACAGEVVVVNKEEEEKQIKIITDQYNEQTTPYYAASRLWVDGVIDPIETRKAISMGIEAANQAPITKKFNVGIIQT